MCFRWVLASARVDPSWTGSEGAGGGWRVSSLGTSDLQTIPWISGRKWMDGRWVVYLTGTLHINKHCCKCIRVCQESIFYL